MKKILSILLSAAIAVAFNPFIDTAYASSKYEIYYSGAMKVISADGVNCSFNNSKGCVTVYEEGTITLKMKNTRTPSSGVIEVLRAKSLAGFYDGSCKKVGTFNANDKGYVTAKFKIGGSLKCYAINWWDSLPEEDANETPTANESSNIFLCKSGDILFSKVSGVSYTNDGEPYVVKKKGTVIIEAESAMNGKVLNAVKVKSGSFGSSLDDVIYDTEEGIFEADASGKVLITLELANNRAYLFSVADANQQAGSQNNTSETPSVSSPSNITSPTDLSGETTTPTSNPAEKVKELLGQVSIATKVKYSSNNYIIVSAKIDQGQSSIKEIQELGYTVKYKYYRSTKSGSKYSLKKTSSKSSFTDKSGTKGKKYYYKVTLLVEDETGAKVCSIPLSEVNYVSKKCVK